MLPPTRGGTCVLVQIYGGCIRLGKENMRSSIDMDAASEYIYQGDSHKHGYAHENKIAQIKVGGDMEAASGEH